MAMERIHLREFLGQALEQLGPAIPDRVVFSCRFDDTPEVHADPDELLRTLGELLAHVCEAGDEVMLRSGIVSGRSGPHAFFEVSRPDAGTRLIVPVPLYRRDMRLAADAPGR
jgi:hypothetical protein